MIKKSGYILAVIFSFVTTSGTSQVSSHKNINNFHEEFNRQNHDVYLLLSCMVYSKMVNHELSLSIKDTFINISGTFHDYINPGKNIDSLIDEFVKQNKNIDYESDSSRFFLNLFMENFNIVEGIIFVNVSDNNDESMKSVKDKILNVPGLASIYRLYMGKDRDLASLSSDEGIGLDIQIAYYLCTLNYEKRNEILRKLL